MRLFAPDYRSGRCELVASWPVPDPVWVLGKWLAALAVAVVLILASGAYFGTVWLLGDPEPGPLLSAWLGLLLFAAPWPPGACWPRPWSGTRSWPTSWPSPWARAVPGGGAGAASCRHPSASSAGSCRVLTHFEKFSRGRDRQPRRGLLPGADGGAPGGGLGGAGRPPPDQRPPAGRGRARAAGAGPGGGGAAAGHAPARERGPDRQQALQPGAADGADPRVPARGAGQAARRRRFGRHRRRRPGPRDGHGLLPAAGPGPRPDRRPAEGLQPAQPRLPLPHGRSGGGAGPGAPVRRQRLAHHGGVGGRALVQRAAAGRERPDQHRLPGGLGAAHPDPAPAGPRRAPDRQRRPERLLELRPGALRAGLRRCENLHLPVAGRVPAGADVVVIAGPRTEPGPQELAALEAHLARGGAVLGLFDPPTPEAWRALDGPLAGRPDRRRDHRRRPRRQRSRHGRPHRGGGRRLRRPRGRALADGRGDHLPAGAAAGGRRAGPTAWWPGPSSCAAAS